MKTSSQIYRLIRIYSKVLVGAVVLFIALVFTHNLINTYQQRTREMEQITTLMYQELSQDNQLVTQLSLDLTDSKEKVQSFDKIFSLSYADYLNQFVLNEVGVNKPYLPHHIRSAIVMNPTVEQLIIKHEDYDDIYFASRNHPSGRIIEEPVSTENRYILKVPLMDRYEFRIFGEIQYYLQDDAMRSIHEMFNDKNIFELLVVDKNDDIIFDMGHDYPAYREFLEAKSESGKLRFHDFLKNSNYQYNKMVTSGDYTIFTLSQTDAMVLSSPQIKEYWILVAMAIVAILVYSLRYIFKNYARQVEDIVETLENPHDGILDARIDITNKEGELKLIAENINKMLDNINAYVDEILMLELRQKEAELSALQAQINPHFMYNTLEYIRMNVLSEGLDDLSEVVFSFATLLRNNISAEKILPLKKELDFCEKYVFLYQIRHPKHIAYSFNVEREMENMMVPRFILQPLIENYLLHGLDYTRVNNAISVSAYKEGSRSIIEVRDNGKGMSETQLEALKQSLQSDQQVFQGKSIGMMNVNARIAHFYQGRASMDIQLVKPSGVSITIVIEGETHV